MQLCVPKLWDCEKSLLNFAFKIYLQLKISYKKFIHKIVIFIYIKNIIPDT